MSFRGFVLRNGLRNKRRVILTVLSVSLALFVMATLISFVNQIDANLEISSPLRLITRHAVSLGQPLPERYYAQIRAVPGVVAASPLSWFGGYHIDQGTTDFAQFACDPETVFDVYPEFRVPEDQKQAFIKERTAIAVGRGKAEKHGWKLGDRITLKGAIYPVDLEFIVRAIFEADSLNQEGQVFFHYRYLDEALGKWGIIGTVSFLADSVDSVPRLAETIDDMYQNTNPPTKTETEKAFTMGFISMLGNLKVLVATLSGIILFTILLVTANTMAMSVRERIREIAVLKSLGFRRGTVLALLVSEGLMITLVGGLLGCLGARWLFSTMDLAAFSQGFFQVLEVGWGTIAFGLAIAAAVGILSAGIPGWRASRLTVAEGLRHVG